MYISFRYIAIFVLSFIPKFMNCMMPYAPRDMGTTISAWQIWSRTSGWSLGPTVIKQSEAMHVSLDDHPFGSCQIHTFVCKQCDGAKGLKRLAEQVLFDEAQAAIDAVKTRTEAGKAVTVSYASGTSRVPGARIYFSLPVRGGSYMLLAPSQERLRWSSSNHYSPNPRTKQTFNWGPKKPASHP